MDIVEELRMRHKTERNYGGFASEYRLRAAIEIERLRAELANSEENVCQQKAYTADVKEQLARAEARIKAYEEQKPIGWTFKHEIDYANRRDDNIGSFWGERSHDPAEDDEIPLLTNKIEAGHE